MTPDIKSGEQVIHVKADLFAYTGNSKTPRDHEIPDEIELSTLPSNEKVELLAKIHNPIESITSDGDGTVTVDGHQIEGKIVFAKPLPLVHIRK